MSKILIILGILHIFSTSLFCQGDRESWQPPDKIMDSIGVKEGMEIGEVGVGQGYLTFHLADRVGDTGKIYANEIDAQSLKIIETRIISDNIQNIETVLGEVQDPLFPKKDLDMIVMVYVLHCLDKPTEFMGNLEKYLSENGRLVIIERNTLKERAHPPAFMTNKQILASISEDDFELERKVTFLPKDTIYIFRIKLTKKLSTL